MPVRTPGGAEPQKARPVAGEPRVFVAAVAAQIIHFVKVVEFPGFCAYQIKIATCSRGPWRQLAVFGYHTAANAVSSGWRSIRPNPSLWSFKIIFPK